MKKKKILKILKILVEGGLGESPKNITNKTARILLSHLILRLRLNRIMGL